MCATQALRKLGIRAVCDKVLHHYKLIAHISKHVGNLILQTPITTTLSFQDNFVVLRYSIVFFVISD